MNQTIIIVIVILFGLTLSYFVYQINNKQNKLLADLREKYDIIEQYLKTPSSVAVSDIYKDYNITDFDPVTEDIMKEDKDENLIEK